jgi:hypothetical protein
LAVGGNVETPPNYTIQMIEGKPSRRKGRNRE